MAASLFHEVERGMRGCSVRRRYVRRSLEKLSRRFRRIYPVAIVDIRRATCLHCPPPPPLAAFIETLSRINNNFASRACSLFFRARRRRTNSLLAFGMLSATLCCEREQCPGVNSYFVVLRGEAWDGRDRVFQWKTLKTFVLHMCELDVSR